MFFAVSVSTAAPGDDDDDLGDYDEEDELEPNVKASLPLDTYNAFAASSRLAGQFRWHGGG